MNFQLISSTTTATELEPYKNPINSSFQSFQRKRKVYTPTKSLKIKQVNNYMLDNHDTFQTPPRKRAIIENSQDFLNNKYEILFKSSQSLSPDLALALVDVGMNQLKVPTYNVFL